MPTPPIILIVLSPNQLCALRGLTLALGVISLSAVVSAETLEEERILPLLDWQPMQVIPVKEQDLRCRQCGGRFVDPFAALSHAAVPAESDLEVSADNTDVTEQELIFTGNVAVTQGARTMRADTVTADRAQQTAIASGNVLFREPGIALTGDIIYYDSVAEQAEVSGAEFVMHDRHMSGAAGQLIRTADGRIEITDGRMSYCAPDDPSWVLHADALEIDPESGDGQAWGAKIKVSGVPVLYLPWIRFPVDSRRKSGLLFPDIGSDTRGGIDITSPIYLNLAPNYDALYSPRYIQERGLLHQAKGRWLSEAFGYWEMSGGYIGNDSKLAGADDDADNARWLVNTQHRGYFGEHWRTQINFSRTSDAEYIRDLNNANLSAQRQTALQQFGRVDWLGDDWQFRVDFEQFQSLAQDIREDYKKLPQLTARWVGDAAMYGVQPLLLSQLSFFEADNNRITGQRLYNEVGVTKPMNWQAGFIRPTVKYRSVHYELDDHVIPIDTSPSSGALLGSVDSGLLFERQTNLLGKAMTQTLEPRAYYLYSQYDDPVGQPDFDSAELTFSYGQLYRDTRFSGHDRIDDANQLSLGVTTRFYDNTSGDEVFSASVGQIYYFRDRKVRLNGIDPALTEATSPIAAEAAWSPNQRWKLRASLLYDTNENTFDAAYAQASYRTANGALFNAGYILREPPPSLLDRPVTEQTNLSAHYPINENWSLFGAFEYSLEADTAVEDMFGVEYDDCCWRVRVLYLRYIDTLVGNVPNFSDPNLQRESAVQIQIMLKGMGGFGGRVDNLLSDMIRGFDPKR